MGYLRNTIQKYITPHDFNVKIKYHSRKIIFNKKFILLIILLFALFLRLYFFTGLIHALPQEDGIYHGHAVAVCKNEFSLLRFKNLSLDYVADPSETFQFRFMAYLPTAFFYTIFGINEITTGMWSLLCSLGSILLVYLFGKEFFDELTGLIGAFLLAIFPLDILLSTRLLADTPLMFLMALSSFLFLRGMKYDDKKQIFVSGIILGLGYVTKMTAVLAIGLIIILLIFVKIKQKQILARILSFLGLFLVGFLIIYFVEGIYLYYATGDFFLRSKIFQTAMFSKYTVPGKDIEKINSLITIGKIKIIYDPDTFFQHIKTLFGLWQPTLKREIINYFGYFYYLVFPAVAIFLYEKYKKPKNNKAFFQYFFILWLFILFLYLEFGFLKIDINNGFLRYFMLFKAPRFLAIITIPSILFLAWTINPKNLLSFFKKTKPSTYLVTIISVTIIVFLSFTSIYYTARSHDFLNQSVTDFKEAYNFIKKYPKYRVYADPDVSEMLQYYSGYERKNIYPLTENQTILNGSIVILGGMRSIDIDPEIILKYTPRQLTPIITNDYVLDGWILIKKIDRDPFGIRVYDMKIFLLEKDYQIT